MIFIVEDAGERIMEYAARLVAAHSVLAEIAGGLATIPFKAKAHDPFPSICWPDGGHNRRGACSASCSWLGSAALLMRFGAAISPSAPEVERLELHLTILGRSHNGYPPRQSRRLFVNG